VGSGVAPAPGSRRELAVLGGSIDPTSLAPLAGAGAGPEVGKRAGLLGETAGPVGTVNGRDGASVDGAEPSGIGRSGLCGFAGSPVEVGRGATPGPPGTAGCPVGPVGTPGG